MEWFYLSGQLVFLHCSDAIGWIIWSVKIVTIVTYKVSTETLTLCSLTRITFTAFIQLAEGSETVVVLLPTVHIVTQCVL